MYRIFVKDLDKSMSAVNWCQESIKTNWNIEHRWPADGYFFIFDDEKDALIFSLTCA